VIENGGRRMEIENVMARKRINMGGNEKVK